jgi:hypothetical protein
LCSEYVIDAKFISWTANKTDSKMVIGQGVSTSYCSEINKLQNVITVSWKISEMIMAG